MSTIYISDVMDLVAATVEIQGWDEAYGPPELVWTCTYTWPGVGLTGGLRWLERALNDLLEDVQDARTKGPVRASADGGTHTLYGSGGLSNDVMG